LERIVLAGKEDLLQIISKAALYRDKIMSATHVETIPDDISNQCLAGAGDLCDEYSQESAAGDDAGDERKFPNLGMN